MVGYQVKWRLDDARFDDCEGGIYHSKAEAIVAITLSVMARKAELMDEYRNDDTVYDVQLKKDVKLTFEQWVANCIDNFCELQRDIYWLACDFDKLGE